MHRRVQTRSAISNASIRFVLFHLHSGGKPIGFKDCTFHRIIKDFMIQVAYLVVALKYDLNLSLRYSPSIQGGDFIRGDGTGSTCTVLSFHCHTVSTAALFFVAFRHIFLPFTPTQQAFTEISLMTKTFHYPILVLAFCLWQIVAQTPMAVNSSSRAQKQTGAFSSYSFAGRTRYVFHQA